MTDTESSPKKTPAKSATKATKTPSKQVPKTPTKQAPKTPSKSVKKEVPRAPSTPEPAQTRSEPPDSPDRMAPSAISDDDHLTNGEHEEYEEEDEENGLEGNGHAEGLAEGEEEGREEEEEEGAEEEEYEEEEDDDLTERDPNEASRDLGEQATSRVPGTEAVDNAKDTAEETAEGAKETAKDTKDSAKDKAEDTKASAKDKAEDAKATAGDKAAEAKETAEDKAEDTKATAEDTAGDAKGAAEETTDGAKGTAEDTVEATKETAEGITEEIIPAAEVNEAGDVVDDDGNVIGRVTEGDKSKLGGSLVSEEGDIIDKDGNVVGKADPIEEEVENIGEAAEEAADETKSQVDSAKSGLDEEEKPNVEDLKDTAEETAEGVEKPDVDEAKEGVEGAVEGAGEKAEGAVDEAKEGAKDVADGVSKPDVDPVEEPEILQSKLKGPFDIQESGEILDAEGKAIGKLQDDVDLKSLAGKQGFNVDGEGNLVGENGTIIGKVDLLPVNELPIPESVKERVLNAAIPEGASQLGSKLEGSKADLGSQAPDADQAKEGIEEGKEGLEGAVEGAEEKAEGAEEEAESNIPPVSILEGLKVNKAGKIVDKDGNPIGQLVEGDAKKLAGKKCDKEGKIWNDAGKVIGRAEPLPEVEENEAAPFEDFPGALVDKSGKIVYEGEVIGQVIEGDVKKMIGKTVDADGDILDKNGNVIGKAERTEEEPAEGAEEEAESNIPPVSILEGMKVNKAGKIVDRDGNPIGQLVEGDAKKLAGKKCDKEGKIWSDAGKVIGRAEPLPEVEENEAAPFEDFPGALVDKSGKIVYEGEVIGQVIEGDVKKMIGKTVDADGDILDKNGNVIGKAERTEEEPEPEPEGPDYSVLADKKINKAGNVVDDSGRVVGRVIQGVLKNMIGRRCDKNGDVWNDNGKVMGKCEPIPDAEKEELKEPAPFEDFPDATVERNGDVISEGEIIGKVVEGDAKKLHGKKVDADGDIVDRYGNVLGKAERWDAPEKEPEPEIDNSSLAGKRVNKAGNVVDKNGEIYGRLIEGDVKQLAGKMCDKQGFVRNEAGDIIGRCQVVPEGDREGLKEGPFTDFDGCTVTKEGKVVTSKGEVVGRLISGDPNVLYGRAVDDDGEIVDKNGNVVGKAERWAEEEVKKDVNPMAGRKVNKEGNIVDENGDIIGKLTSGDLGVCAGKKVDDDGDVVDSKGTTIGHVSLLQDIPAEEVKKDASPMSGRKVNKEGNVVDENGDIMGKLTSGDVSVCAGKTVDDEGDVVDSKGQTVGHVTLLQDIREEEPEPEPEPEPEETEEEKKAREDAELDQKLCKQMAWCVEDSLEKIRPILKMITTKIEEAERKPKEELDEEQLVKDVKPLIEEGGRILTEANASIRALDPGGRLQSQAKAKASGREATPDEYHLAELLKELTGSVTETIDKAKRKIDGMPHAKKELNPLWGLLSEPLFQILAAVGLLLSGVLGLVGKLLSGLGLGNLVDNLLGGLGLKSVLGNLGLGGVLDSLTGKKKK
ncbi:hypothetical protein ACMFMG_005344 [Clarireedia jacksonii]